MAAPATAHTKRRPCDRCGAPTDTALCHACRRRLSARLCVPSDDDAAAPEQVAARDEAPPPRRPSPPPVTIGGDLVGRPEVVSAPGSIVVEGRVGTGWRLEAMEGIAVDGLVDGADLLAGIGAVRLDGPCRQTEVRAGVARVPLQRAAEALAGAGEELATLLRMTKELRLAAAMRGTAIPVRDALAALVTARAPDLASRLDAALTILRAGRDRAGATVDPLLTAVSTTRAAIASQDDLALLTRAATDLASALDAAGAVSGLGPRSL
ncbi:MAG: hypothetical protein AB1416_12235, partial [Actinomycetota bacterium]